MEVGAEGTLVSDGMIAVVHNSVLVVHIRVLAARILALVHRNPVLVARNPVVVVRVVVHKMVLEVDRKKVLEVVEEDCK